MALPPPHILQQLLAQVQASNTLIICQNEFPNRFKGKQKILLSLFQDGEKIHLEAREIFTKLRPDYRIDNLLTPQLTKNALDDISKDLEADTFSISNGCCNNPKCPTKTFYGSVVLALEKLAGLS
jgi:hypothetical protein